MVTARVEEIDRLFGLELGADDQVCKPFSPGEVVARVRAVLRRVENSGTVQPRGLRVDVDRHCASISGITLELTPVEFTLLAHFVTHPGQGFSRQQLMNAVYSDYRVVSYRTIDTQVKNLRRTLEQSAPEIKFIESIDGVGYRLTG